jgi:beta-hydroxyacyl-ACP dehydratase FabZ
MTSHEQDGPGEEPMGEEATVLDIRGILDVLPHRYPFLLVDRIIRIETGKRAVGIKNVTFNEPFFQGHFPGNPIMPGVLIVEAMAQVGAVLLLRGVPDRHAKLVYFAGIDRAKFRRPVTPGDQVRIEVEVLKLRSRSARLRGEAFVDGVLVAEAEMFSSMVDRDGATDAGTEEP